MGFLHAPLHDISITRHGSLSSLSRSCRAAEVLVVPSPMTQTHLPNEAVAVSSRGTGSVGAERERRIPGCVRGPWHDF